MGIEYQNKLLTGPSYIPGPLADNENLQKNYIFNLHLTKKGGPNYVGTRSQTHHF